MGELDGRVALVTGSTRGLGRAIAERFAAEGATVVVHGRRTEDAAAVAAQLPGGAGLAIGADLAVAGEASRLVADAIAGAGGLHVLVNNAGLALDNFISGVTPERWNTVLEVNLSAAFWAMQSAVRQFRDQGEGGAVVNVISWSGVRGNIGQVAYSAAKAGLVGMTLAAAKELARFGIRVNALSPSAESDMTAQITAEQRAAAIENNPMGRFGRPEEVAEAALFLAGPRASYTTGQILNVDGGLHLK